MVTSKPTALTFNDTKILISIGDASDYGCDMPRPDLWAPPIPDRGDSAGAMSEGREGRNARGANVGEGKNRMGSKIGLCRSR